MSLGTDVFYIFVRSTKKLLRNPFLIFFSLVQPIMWLLLFTQLFEKIANLPRFPAQSYLEFAAPGIVLFNAFSSAFQSGLTVVDDIRSGFLEKLLVTPMRRSAILLGRMLTDAVRMVIQSILILVMALVLGAHVETGILGVLLMLATIAFFGLAWAGISHAVGLRTKSTEAVFGFGLFLTFPLLFMSTTLMPDFFMPDWMKTISKYNPISFTVDALRALMLTGFDWNVIVQSYVVMASLAIVTIGAATFMFRRAVE